MSHPKKKTHLWLGEGKRFCIEGEGGILLPECRTPPFPAKENFDIFSLKIYT